MRKYFILMFATLCFGIGLTTALQAQNVDSRTQRKMLKSQQKLEWHALRVEQQNRRLSWKAQKVSSAQRVQANHQMQRERRNLKQRQRDAMQDMRDRNRSQRAIQRAYTR